MHKKIWYSLGAALLALCCVGPLSQARASDFVKAPATVAQKSRSIQGQASRGVDVTLKSAHQKTITSTHASKKNGRYVLKFPRRYAAGTKLYVTAQRGNDHPYRIVWVKSPARSTVKKSTRAKSNRRPVKPIRKNRAKRNTKRTRRSTNRTRTNVNHVTVNSPSGVWYHGAQRWTFTQRYGLNEYYHGKNTVDSAEYHVVPKTNAFWRINYRPKHQRRNRTLYLRFLNNNKFTLVNSHNRILKSSVFTRAKK